MELEPDIRLVLAALDGGGSERVALLLGNEWSRQGLNVEFVLARRLGVFLNQLAEGVAVYSPDARRTLTALPSIARRLNRHPGVPALLFGFDLGVGLGALKRFGLVRSPLIYREGSSPRANVPVRWHWRYRAFVAHVDGVVVQTASARDALLALGVRGPPHRVIPNPVALRDGYVGSRAGRRDCCGPIVLAVGRLSPEKGFVRLLRAWPAVKGRFPGARLTIVGDGPERSILLQAVEDLCIGDSVSLLGFVHDVDRLYVRADVFVLSSHYEGQPNVLTEALLSGCRPVAAGGPGVRELLDGVGLGECWIQDNEFENELITGIQRALSLDEAQLTHAIELMRQKTNVTTVAAEYWELCRLVTQSVASQNRPRPAAAL